MDILDTMRTQGAVYWDTAGTDRYGNPTYSEPIDIRVRWDDTTELIRNKNNDQIASRARVAFDEALRDRVNEEGVMRRGTVAQLVDATKPFANSGAMEIQRVDVIPTLDGDEFYCVAYL